MCTAIVIIRCSLRYLVITSIVPIAMIHIHIDVFLLFDIQETKFSEKCFIHTGYYRYTDCMIPIEL